MKKERKFLFMKNSRRNVLKSRNGITLVALVVTIIVLIILAGISISLVLGDNGIITKAKDAKTKTGVASAKEQIQLQILGSFDNGANLNLTQLKNNLQSIGATVEGDNFPITATLNKLSYTINVDGSIGEREWTIAWVYKNSNWSNPYFKDETLKNQFTFEDIDESYSLTSEEQIVGQLIVKLFSNRELEISGSGIIAQNIGYDANTFGGVPWFGFYHESGMWEGEVYSSYSSESDFAEYLENNISSIKICEGITSIGQSTFQTIKATSVSLPSTLTEINEEAFRDSSWLLNLSNDRIWIPFPGNTLV